MCLLCISAELSPGSLLPPHSPLPPPPCPAPHSSRQPVAAGTTASFPKSCVWMSPMEVPFAQSMQLINTNCQIRRSLFFYRLCPNITVSEPVTTLVPHCPPHQIRRRQQQACSCEYAKHRVCCCVVPYELLNYFSHEKP